MHLFQNRVREKVERLLVVRIAKTMLQRARTLDWSRRMPSIKQVVASLVDFLAAEGVETTNDFGELSRPRCPLCGAECKYRYVVRQVIRSAGAFQVFNQVRFRSTPALMAIDCVSIFLFSFLEV